MARKRNPRRDEAFELFKENAGNIANRKIAEILDVPEKTISGWKSKDQWNNKMNGVLQTDERSTPNNKGSTKNKGGAPLGNKNGLGNKGGAAPNGNKNAVTTGAFETILYEYLSDKEKAIYEEVEEPSSVLTKTIQTLKVRKLRMLNRIKQAEDGLTENEEIALYEIRGVRQTFQKDDKRVSIEIPNLIQTERREKTTPKIDLILKIEGEITKIDMQLTKTIKQLEELDMNESRKNVYAAQEKKLKAETNEIGGASTTDEVEDWKKAVIDAANKRVVKDNGW